MKKHAEDLAKQMGAIKITNFNLDSMKTITSHWQLHRRKRARK